MAELEKQKTAPWRLFRGPSVHTLGGDQRTVSVQGDAEHNLIITGDVNVSLAVDAARIEALSPVHQLPADLADFAGRERQAEKLLSVLNARGGRVAISSIEGMGGLGKTALAVHVAHRLTERYPDGQIMVDMAATSATRLTTEQALVRVIRAFEPEIKLPKAAAELQPIYLSTLRGKRVLLILDNAFDGNQVAPLVPPENCGLLVTSRRRIAVAGLVRVDLDLLSPEEATGLLRSIVGENRVATGELMRIAELCGLLPLALRVAGMFLVANPHWSAEKFVAALTNERRRLGHLRLEGNAALDVAASLALSVRELRVARPDIADRWHELEVFPAGFDTAGAAAVWDLPVEAAEEALGLLLSRSMVLYDPAQERWRLHDLMRDIASGRAAVEILGTPADFEARISAARRRHAEHYREVLEMADFLYLKGSEYMPFGLALFFNERRNIETGQAWAVSAAAEDPAAAGLCVSFPEAGANMLEVIQRPRQRIAWLESAVAAARTIGDRRAEGGALGNLGNAYADLGNLGRALELYKQHLAIARGTGHRQGESNALGNLGITYGSLDDPRRAIALFEEALAITREIGDRRGEGNTLGGLGAAHAALGEHRRAIELYEESLAIAQEIGDRRGEGIVLNNIGTAYADLGDPHHAIDFYERRIMIARETADQGGEGNALGNLGDAHAALGNHRRAIELYEQQLAIAREIEDRPGEGKALSNLGLAYGGLGDRRCGIRFLEDALNIFQAIESPDAAQVSADISKLKKEGGL
jgi:tetratricopeptide (TPR) repeat protein